MENNLACPNCGSTLDHDYLESFGFNRLEDLDLTVWHYCPKCKKEIEIKFDLIFKNIKILEENK